VIVLDTHIWIWWVQNDSQLPPSYRHCLSIEQSKGLVICSISLWETALLASRGRLLLPIPCADWMAKALTARGIQVAQLTTEVAIESTNLPGSFHRDPADQIIVGTARTLDCPLITLDGKIRSYPHVKLLP
jgi:PIN domain nuclease of toxin-antitoxin system